MVPAAPFVAVAATDELADGQMKAVRAGGRRLLVVNADGRFHVVDEMCSHEDYSLALGCVREGRVKCSLHGSWFDLETGAALVDPATEPLGTYPVRIAEGRVWVDPTPKPGSEKENPVRSE